MPVAFVEIGSLIAREIAADRPPLTVEIDADIAAEERAYDDGAGSSGLPMRF